MNFVFERNKISLYEASSFTFSYLGVILKIFLTSCKTKFYKLKRVLLLLDNLSLRASNKDSETFRVVKSGGFNEDGTKS